jgi:hypothetical protein
VDVAIVTASRRPVVLKVLHLEVATAAASERSTAIASTIDDNLPAPAGD